MLGPVFAPDGGAFAAVGLEEFAAGFGVRMGDNLVVDPSRRQRRRGAVGVGGRARANYLPHPITARFGGRLTYWPRTREVAPRAPPVPGLHRHAAGAHQPDGWGETDLATIRGDADLAFDAARDRKGPVRVAVAVERAREARRRAWCSWDRAGW